MRKTFDEKKVWFCAVLNKKCRLLNVHLNLLSLFNVACVCDNLKYGCGKGKPA